MTDIDKQIEERKTCKDLIAERLADREEYLDGLLIAVESDVHYDGYDDPMEAAYEYPLGISFKKLIRIQLSTGGPADWIEVVTDESNDPYEMTYHYADWYDHAEVKIYEDSPFWKYYEQFIEESLHTGF